MGARAVKGRSECSDWGSDTWDDIEMKSVRQNITLSKNAYLLANTIDLSPNKGLPTKKISHRFGEMALHMLVFMVKFTLLP